VSHIEPRQPGLLTDLDVNYEPFRCCGDEDLVFIKCPACQHLMVFCYECDTLCPDLSDPAKASGLTLIGGEYRVVCPLCGKAFEDSAFLMQPYVDKYLVTAEEVVGRGFGHLLARPLRGKHSAERGAAADRGRDSGPS
jgi:hypothetical protein